MSDGPTKITFSYPRSLEDLLQDVASLHESASGSAAPPSLIIVDGLEGYMRGPGVSGGLQQAEQSSAAHISALLYDTAAFLSQTLEERAASLAPCRVIASFQSEWEGHAGGDSSDPVLSVLDRYFQVRCTLDQDWNSAPAVAEPQDTWHVYLSGAGITEAPIAEDEEDSSLAREWRLVICPNRSMEFTMV
uniref:SWIM-type zinc finger 7 associated protein 1 n=1 Tax=Oncorhynchus mykiss TaxID=8022 RepID=A0A8C7QM83_ONCMY